jgi:hypothetical protein
LPQVFATPGSRWGDVMAFFGSVLGILVMIKSQEGFVSSHAPPAEADSRADT